MGYELHIVRRNDYDDYEEESNITLEEWLKYVESDSELELTNGYQIKIPGVQHTFQNVPGFCNWIGHTMKRGDEQPWFDYGFGSITTKYPDDETIGKMIKIANKLNGRIEGDDGEIYDESYLLNEDGLKRVELSTVLKQPMNKKPWWKLW